MYLCVFVDSGRLLAATHARARARTKALYVGLQLYRPIVQVVLCVHNLLVFF